MHYSHYHFHPPKVAGCSDPAVFPVMLSLHPISHYIQPLGSHQSHVLIIRIKTTQPTTLNGQSKSQISLLTSSPLRPSTYPRPPSLPRRASSSHPRSPCSRQIPAPRVARFRPAPHAVLSSLAPGLPHRHSIRSSACSPLGAQPDVRLPNRPEIRVLSQYCGSIWARRAADNHRL